MAKFALPDALTRRDWIEQSLDPQRASKIAEAYLADGRVAESVVFLAQAEAWDRLRELREEAIRGGDAFLCREVSRALREEPSAEQWRTLAASAREAGKDLYAAEAERQASRKEA